jgi:hypothetical protein
VRSDAVKAGSCASGSGPIFMINFKLSGIELGQREHGMDLALLE